ncbi:MAG: ATP-dependent zinc metalloprotease FtsH [Clostridia bacterium]
MNKNYFRNASTVILAILLVMFVFRSFFSTGETYKAISYSEFMQSVNNKQITEVIIQTQTTGTMAITGKLKDNTLFTTSTVQNADLVDSLAAKGLTVTVNDAVDSSKLIGWISTGLTLVIFVGLFFFLMQQMNGGGGKVMQFGKSRAKLQNEGSQKITFEDVAGCDEVKEELAEIIDFLKDPKRYAEIGAKIPRGVLLYGAPGTGKTLLAKAISGEAKVPFFSISGSDFVEMFVGVGASRVRDLFEQAHKAAPCIIFIDEIDAVGRQRGAGLGGGHDEREQTLNQLLVEMDGFVPNEGLIMIAATNRPDILDPALLRPGRFDREIYVDLPDLKGREAILKVHARTKLLEKDVDLYLLARKTPGFTGADLANLMNEGALLSVRRGKKLVGLLELEDAVERVMAGPEKKNKIIKKEDRKLTAYHEVGHAIVNQFLANTDPVHKITIIPRGRAGGYTMMIPEEEGMYKRRSQLRDEIITLLAGRAAEEIFLDDISTGASSDLERATAIVRKMNMELGMSDKLGTMTYGHKAGEPFLGRDLARERDYSDDTARLIDQEAKTIITESYEKAKAILLEHKELVEKVVDALMEKETLQRKEFLELVGDFATIQKEEEELGRYLAARQEEETALKQRKEERKKQEEKELAKALAADLAREQEEVPEEK